METNSKLLRPATAIFLASIITLISGCAIDGTERRPQASRDAVDICHTQATQTSCYREKATAFADYMETLHEQEEMVELEHYEDW